MILTRIFFVHSFELHQAQYQFRIISHPFRMTGATAGVTGAPSWFKYPISTLFLGHRIRKVFHVPHNNFRRDVSARSAPCRQFFPAKPRRQ
jgi:hypothetical protein